MCFTDEKVGPVAPSAKSVAADEDIKACRMVTSCVLTICDVQRDIVQGQSSWPATVNAKPETHFTSFIFWNKNFLLLML